MLKETLSKFFKLDGLIDNLTGYLETRIELMKLEIKEDIGRGIAKVILLLGVVSFFTLFVFFISMAIAYKIGESFGVFEGFTIVAGFYFLVGMLLFLFKNPLTEKLEKQITESMQSKKNKE